MNILEALLNGPALVILIVAVVVAVLLIIGYLKAPPDTAYIISGLGKKRILIGKAGWRIPFFERVDKLSLRVMQVDVKTSEAVPTNEFINVVVDGVANIKISSDAELLKRAAESLLGMRQPELISMVTQVLEGNMREIVGSVGLKEMVQDRQGVAKKITENVVPDMRKLGIEVVNFNIQNFKDNAGTIENMGIDNVEQIRKNAQIAKANAQRDIAIATSNAQQEANAIKVQAEKLIAEQNAELAVQQADMKVKADTKKAEADAAYSIQQEQQRKTIEVTRTNADIAKKEKEAELAEKEIALKERQLDAEIRKQADAMKYQAEKQAEAELVRRQRDADAKAYEALKEAEARKAEAEALRFSMEQEAEGIRAKGLAEAEAIEKKAEAQRKMGEASVLEMYLTALPEVVKNAATPLAHHHGPLGPDGQDRHVRRRQLHQAGQGRDVLRQPDHGRHEGIHRHRPPGPSGRSGGRQSGRRVHKRQSGRRRYTERTGTQSAVKDEKQGLPYWADPVRLCCYTCVGRISSPWASTKRRETPESKAWAISVRASIVSRSKRTRSNVISWASLMPMVRILYLEKYSSIWCRRVRTRYSLASPCGAGIRTSSRAGCGSGGVSSMRMEIAPEISRAVRLARITYRFMFWESPLCLLQV